MSMRFRVWWCPQVPCKPFYVDVISGAEGIKMMRVLGDYDRFQFENKIKPDYANMGGVEVYDEEEADWVEWEGDEEELD